MSYCCIQVILSEFMVPPPSRTDSTLVLHNFLSPSSFHIYGRKEWLNNHNSTIPFAILVEKQAFQRESNLQLFLHQTEHQLIWHINWLIIGKSIGREHCLEAHNYNKVCNQITKTGVPKHELNVKFHSFYGLTRKSHAKILHIISCICDTFMKAYLLLTCFNTPTERTLSDLEIKGKVNCKFNRASFNKRLRKT